MVRLRKAQRQPNKAYEDRLIAAAQRKRVFQMGERMMCVDGTEEAAQGKQVPHSGEGAQEKHSGRSE